MASSDDKSANMNTFSPTTLRQNPRVDRYSRMREAGVPCLNETGTNLQAGSSRPNPCYSEDELSTIYAATPYKQPSSGTRRRNTSRQYPSPLAVSTPKTNPIYVTSAREIDLSNMSPSSCYNTPEDQGTSYLLKYYSCPTSRKTNLPKDAVNTPCKKASISICPSRTPTMSPDSLESCKDDNLYEMDECVINSLGEPTGEYVVSLKSRLDKHPVQKFTVMEHFHRLMKETLGERLYASLLKKGVLSKNLPDEIVTRKIMDALELKNKLLFSSSDATVSAIDKLNFIHAAGSFRGALRAAMSATANVKDRCLEDAVTEEVMEYEGVFLKHDKPRPEIRVIGYVGVTNLD